MQVLTGNEHLKFDGMPINRLLSDFWKWNSSDLLNNTMRGAFAEFIIATALDLDLTTTHVDWESYDLLWGKKKIEVKCSAYLQSWYPKNQPDKYTKIIFSISPAYDWIPDEARYDYDNHKRHSNVYVFCHYKSKERDPENPLNLNNWDFYVLATYKIDAVFGTQRSISLSGLINRGKPTKCDYSGIRNAIEKEYQDYLQHTKKQ